MDYFLHIETGGLSAAKHPIRKVYLISGDVESGKLVNASELEFSVLLPADVVLETEPSVYVRNGEPFTPPIITETGAHDWTGISVLSHFSVQQFPYDPSEPVVDLDRPEDYPQLMVDFLAASPSSTRLWSFPKKFVQPFFEQRHLDLFQAFPVPIECMKEKLFGSSRGESIDTIIGQKLSGFPRFRALVDAFLRRTA